MNEVEDRKVRGRNCGTGMGIIFLDLDPQTHIPADPPGMEWVNPAGSNEHPYIYIVMKKLAKNVLLGLNSLVYLF